MFSPVQLARSLQQYEGANHGFAPYEVTCLPHGLWVLGSIPTLAWFQESMERCRGH